MPEDFSNWNWVVVGLYLSGILAIGFASSRHQKTTEDFFLAGRKMGLIPVGLSLCMTLFSAISYTAITNQSYYHGMLLMMSMAIVWVDAPVVYYIVIPFFYKRKLFSIYEYLELRFSLAARMTGGIIFLFWRMLWLGTVIYAPCKVLQVVIHIATGNEIPVEQLVIFVGVVTTLYTVLGGMRAVIWTDVAQFCVMFGSIVAILAVVWTNMDQGPAEVWQIAQEGGRDRWVHAEFDLEDPWCIWGIVPFYFLARLAFYSADQITMQRVLTAHSLGAAQKAFLLNCVSLSIFIPLLCYVGLNLYAFYQKHPDRVPQQYRAAATAAPEIPAAATDSAKPPESWPKYNPNDKDEKLEDKILPTFVALELPVGIAGLVISALFAACMSTMDSGMNSIATSLIVDFHQRLGIGRSWLARTRGKPEAEINEADELALARPLVFIIGFLATAMGCLIGNLGTVFEIARVAVDTPGIPLACVFLLGMVTRRATSAGALTGLFVGVVTMLWMAIGPKMAPSWIWPFTNSDGSVWNLAPIYPGVFGAIVTVVVGYTASLFLGRPKTQDELRGLAWGAGEVESETTR